MPGVRESQAHSGPKCIYEYRCVCVWLFFIFSLFAPLHLGHIFLSSDPSSKSILRCKISHHLIHSTEINQLPCRHLLKSAPASFSKAGRERPCPLKTLHDNPPAPPILFPPWGAAPVSWAVITGMPAAPLTTYPYRPALPVLGFTGLCLAHLVEIPF